MMQGGLASLASWQNTHKQLSSALAYLTPLKPPSSLSDPSFTQKANNIWYCRALRPFRIQNDEPRQQLRPQQVFLQINRGQMRQLKEGNLIQVRLQECWSVIVQTRENFTKLQQGKQKLKQDINGVNKLGGNKQEKQAIAQRNKKLLSQLKPLTVTWNQSRARYRIILLFMQGFTDYTLYIYHQPKNHVNIDVLHSEGKLDLNSLNNSFDNNLYLQEQGSSFLAQMVKISRIKRKYKKTLENMRGNFKKGIKNSFRKIVEQKKNDMNKSYQNRLKNKKLLDAFSHFDHTIKQQFYDLWNDKVRKVSKQSKIFLQIQEIWIQKESFPDGMRVMVQKASGYKDYQCAIVNGVCQSNGGYLVYRIKPNSNSENSKCFSIKIDESASYFVQIRLIAQVMFNNKKTINFQAKFQQFLFQKRKGEFREQIVLQSKQSPYKCLAYLNILKSKKPNIKSTIAHRKTSIFNNIGKIANKYNLPVSIPYTPDNYPLIRTLLGLGKDMKPSITAGNYQNGYYQLVNFMQRQDYGTIDKKGPHQFSMKERLIQYARIVLRDVGVFVPSNGGHQSTQIKQQIVNFFKGIDQKVTNQMLNAKNFDIDPLQHKNLQQDIKRHTQPSPFIQGQMLKLIRFSSVVPTIKQLPYSIRYQSHLMPILQRFLAIALQDCLNINSSRRSFGQGVFTGKHLLIFFAFLADIYPYCDANHLKTDLYILRWLVQKHLPYFNDYLNRSHVGLQNLISKYLLTLFSGLSPQLTFRIWDFLISSGQRDKARIIVAFTLLAYLQTTQFLPIIPTNQFIEKLQSNMKTIPVDRQCATKYASNAKTYFTHQRTKQKRFQYLMRQNQGSFCQQKMLSRMILGQNRSKITQQNDGRVQMVNIKQQDQPNVMSLNQLSFPLPKPSNYGHPITQLIVFVHHLNIIENILPFNQKYLLRFRLQQSMQLKDAPTLPIRQKSFFYNKTLRIPGQFINKYSQDPISKFMVLGVASSQLVVEVVRVQQDQRAANGQREYVVMNGGVAFTGYNKDRAYRSLVVLKSTNQYNKGENTLTLTFCLKSTAHLNTTHQNNLQFLQNLSEKIMDYDIASQNNQPVRQLQKLRTIFQKMKSPLDEFSQMRYPRLSCAALAPQQQWMSCSRVSIQQLKVIFYHWFRKDRDNLCHQYTKFYQIFAQEHNMQFIYLADALVRAVLASSTSRKKKLTYLFCLGVHYQNAYTKHITTQTINSLVRLIYKQNMQVNACPYLASTCGRIAEAIVFGTDLKNNQNKHDFTEILKDWAYVCMYKYGYNAVILGTHKNLSILRALFDQSTLRMLGDSPQCRFQIVYQYKGIKYLWSAVVKSNNFQVVKRGPKFVGNFATYQSIGYLDSTQQLLLNCQNIIPLQHHSTYTYQQFIELMLSQPLLCNILDRSPLIPSSKHKPIQLPQINEWGSTSVMNSTLRVQNNNKDTSWAIYRSQNCLANWLACRPENVVQKIVRKVDFGDRGRFFVPNHEIISMEEVVLENAGS